MNRRALIILIVLAGASTAAAQPAINLTEFEWNNKLAVVLPGYPLSTGATIKNDALTLCNLTTSNTGDLTIDNTHCADFYDLTKVPLKAFKDGKITVTPAPAGATVQKLVLVAKPATQVSGEMLVDSVTLGDHVPGQYMVNRGDRTLCSALITVGNDRKLVLPAATCVDLVRLTKEELLRGTVKATRQGTPPYTVQLGFIEPPAASGKVTWDTIDSLPASDLVWFDPVAKEWKKTDRDTLKAARTTLAAGRFQVFGKQGGTPVRWVLERAALTGTGVDSHSTDYRSKCRRRARENRSSNVVCFRYQGGWQLLGAPSRGLIMRPNTTVLVIAFVPDGTRVSFDLAGETGIVTPAFDDPGFRANSTLATPLEPELAEVSQPFGPPVPGVHPLTVALASDPDDRSVIDLTVDTAYAGTIRLGVAGVFGGARERTYAKATLPGSSQAEIVASGGGDLDVELVLGAAAFFETGGRTYVAETPRRWAPYFGIGLLNQSSTGLELLKSAHLGIEYELTRNFSIAFTVVGRRVTRLADGLAVGDPIDSATVPTRTGYEFGTAIVVNVSPEFFKLARSPSAGFFQ